MSVVTLLATACPEVQIPSTSPLLSDAYDPAGTTSCARNLTAGTTILTSPWNENAARLDLTGRYGGGGMGIARGLTLTYAGLVATVAAGHAMMDGIVELATATTVGLADGSLNYVWLKQDGTLVNNANSVTAPTGAAVYLGRLTTVAGAVTAYDTSGVVYLRGGILYRETADAAAPTDTPPATILVTKTAGGTYIWNGAAYAAFTTSFTVDNVTIENIGTVAAPSLRVKALGISNSHINAAAAIALSKLATDPLARANHTGTQTADTLTDGTTNKAFLATERTKLAGIATGATANSSDATLLARTNHTGTQLASTISNFDTQVRTSRLDQMAAPTADVSMASHKLTNVTDPGSAQDAATKAYVDAGVALITAGAGLTKTGNTLDVIAADGSITVAADSITVGLVPVPKGGTNATTAAAARANLGTVSKYSALVGDGVATVFNIAQATHLCAADRTNLVSVIDDSTGDVADVSVVTVSIGSGGTVDLTFAVAPTTDQFRVVIVG